MVRRQTGGGQEVDSRLTRRGHDATIWRDVDMRWTEGL